MKRSSNEIKRMKKILEARHWDLVRALGADHSGLLDEMYTGTQPVGDLGKQADVEVTVQLTELESHELQLVEDALKRMVRGRYGICEGCGRKISLTRLRAIPQASLCIKCQREVEQRQLLEAVESDG